MILATSHGLGSVPDFVSIGTIVPLLVNKTVAAGNGIAFRCRVASSGNPQYKIKWKKNGATIGEDGRVTVSRHTWGSRLRIRNARRDDGGLYQCIVKSRNGRKTVSGAWLRVKGKEASLSFYLHSTSFKNGGRGSPQSQCFPILVCVFALMLVLFLSQIVRHQIHQIHRKCHICFIGGRNIS